MKSLLVLLAIVLGFSVAEAKEIRFTLECRWDTGGTPPVGSPHYQAIKIAKQKGKGKWTTEYALKATAVGPRSKGTTYKLESSGNGDEDYSDYVVVRAPRNFGIAGATIQNQFKWVTLSDNEGYSSYRCD